MLACRWHACIRNDRDRGRTHSIGNGLFVQIGHEGLQSFFDDFLIVQRASEHGHFEFLVNRLNHVRCIRWTLAETASIQKGLASLTGQDAIATGNQWIDETVHLMQCLLLCSIAYRFHTQLDGSQSAIDALRVTSDFFQFICWNINMNKVHQFSWNNNTNNNNKTTKAKYNEILTFIQSLQQFVVFDNVHRHQQHISFLAQAQRFLTEFLDACVNLIQRIDQSAMVHKLK